MTAQIERASTPKSTQRSTALRRGAAPALLALLSLIAFAVSVTVTSRSFETVDLIVYRDAAATSGSGGSLYEATYGRFALPFTYPPFAALLFRPLTWLGERPLQLVWTLAGLGALLATLLLTVRAVRGPGRASVAAGLALFALLLWIDPVQNTLAYGQVNLVLLLAILYDVAFARERPWTGALVGLATAVKLTPALIIVYLLARRRYWAAAVAAGTAAAATGAAWILLPGQSRQYWSGLGFDPTRTGPVEYVGNQSLYGVLVRIVHGPPVAHVVWALLVLPLAVAGIAAAARIGRSRGEVFGVGVAALTGLVVSPISWSHHYVWVAVLVAALVAAPAAARGRADGRLAVGLALLFLTQPIWWLPNRDGLEYGYGWWQQVVGASYVLAALGTVAVLLRSSRPATPGSATASSRGSQPRLR